jgi:hypothetical protein
MEITLRSLHSAPIRLEQRLVVGDVKACLDGYVLLHNIALKANHVVLADEILERMYEIKTHYPDWQCYVHNAIGQMDLYLKPSFYQAKK